MSAYCEMYCDRPLRPGDTFGDEDMRACCEDCKPLLRWLTHEVLPAVFRHGYYAPADATAEQELAALVEQARWRPEMRELLAFSDGVRLADGRTFGELWDERPGGDAA